MLPSDEALGLLLPDLVAMVGGRPVVALVAAGTVVATGMLLRLTQDAPDLWWSAAAAALAVASVAVASLAHRPAPHLRARARQLADRVEGLAVVAAIPVAVGVFGVYQRLLETF